MKDNYIDEAWVKKHLKRNYAQKTLKNLLHNRPKSSSFRVALQKDSSYIARKGFKQSDKTKSKLKNIKSIYQPNKATPPLEKDRDSSIIGLDETVENWNQSLNRNGNGNVSMNTSIIRTQSGDIMGRRKVKKTRPASALKRFSQKQNLKIKSTPK